MSMQDDPRQGLGVPLYGPRGEAPQEPAEEPENNKSLEEITELRARTQELLSTHRAAIEENRELKSQLSMLVDRLNQGNKPRSANEEWQSKSPDELHQIIATQLAGLASGPREDDDGNVVSSADPNVLAKAVRQLSESIAQSRVDELMGKYNKNEGLRNAYSKVRSEVTDLLGAKIADEKLMNTAKQIYMGYVQQYGKEMVEAMPHLEKLAAMEAAAKLGVLGQPSGGQGPSAMIGTRSGGNQGRPPQGDIKRLARKALDKGDLATYAKLVSGEMFAGG